MELLKVNLSDGFYHLDLNILEIPKLGVVFPSEDPSKQLMVAPLPLVLPMGWKKSATETILADLANKALADKQYHLGPHSLDQAAAKQDVPLPAKLQPSS